MSEHEIVTPPVAPPTAAQVKAAAESEAHAPYMKVLFGLLVLTIAEYGFARFFRDNPGPLVFGLVLLAATKAALVAWYFMHLKFERFWVFLVIAPACLLAFILTILLFPDFVMRQEPVEEPAATTAPTAPASAAAASRNPLVKLV
ncbi:cytochrome C oxidase subunit IV family protein [Paludisphaera rhizosphaerae]|uniref:cytochrome C oxidase subunit IV family protein n=1 Tax=Paludisphaera rhizosphaerae TaxID=2711216 RepID=UPI0013EDAE4B|nr:cytochrome C oxidase subunit IV family protein [Paludisphaera rhizosphaerae]